MDVIADPSAVVDFLERFKGSSGSNRSNFQSFMRDLCTLLDLPHPVPGEGDTSQNSYVCERLVESPKVDGNTDNRYIDLYRRDCFVLEEQQTGKALAGRSHTAESVAELFKQKPKRSVDEGPQSLTTLGIAELQLGTGT